MPQPRLTLAVLIEPVVLGRRRSTQDLRGGGISIYVERPGGLLRGDLDSSHPGERKPPGSPWMLTAKGEKPCPRSGYFSWY